MNATMKKILAGLLAVCCVPVAGISAAAEGIDWYWGTTTWSGLEGYEQVDNYGWGSNYDNEASVYLKEWSSDEVEVVVIHPNTNTIRIVLREDLDADQAADEMVNVIEFYFPGISATLNEKTFEVCHERYYHLETPDNQVGLTQLDFGITDEEIGRVFDLSVKNMPENASELEAELLSGLAKKNLISAYYGWGGTADYQRTGGYGYRDQPFIEWGEHYSVWSRDEQGKSVRTDLPVDTEGLEAYVAEHYPECRIEEYQSNPYTVRDENGEIVTKTNRLFRLHPAEEMTCSEYLKMGFVLHGLFHVGLSIVFPESEEPPVTGRNLLEKQGDVTLDTELTIVDVIALNKNLMVGEPLCDTAKKNADVDGDGTPDEGDSLAILKEVVEITKGFQE